MELRTLWKLVKRRWWLMAIPALAALVLTLPSLKNVVSPPVTYSVRVRLSAAAPPEAEIEGVTTPYEDTVYVPLLASEYVVVNMPHWITSDTFAAEVSRVLDEQGTGIPAGNLEGAFFADSFRSILTLYVSWDDAAEIRDITQAAITVLQTRNQTYFPQFNAVPVEVVALDAIDVVEAAPPITVRIAPLLRIAVGLVAGVALGVLVEYLDNTVYDGADLEALDLPVLAEIPRE
jgi:hypothetical protein